MTDQILIVDDDRTDRRILTRILRNEYHDCECLEAGNGQEALDILKIRHTDIKLILMDLSMPVMDGYEALTSIVSLYNHIPVIILTGSNQTSDVVEVMKAGAFDFLSKPFDKDRLIVSIRNALKLSLMSQEITRLKQKDPHAFYFSDLIGYETGLKPYIEWASKAASVQIPVLINGETGTGKEMFARAIHGESARSDQPFVAVNCGAIPENLIESTLFGHEKGAFTGAVSRALGKFREANGGTLFLDEIGELPLDAQVKLLRVLQQSEVEPVGAGRAVKVDVRIISATNRDLAEEVKGGRFREDLYYRLNILQMTLPALRDRAGDIEDLAHYFIASFCDNNRTPYKTLSAKAVKALKGYQWPGNVRQLENIIGRAMVLSSGAMIEEGDLAFETVGPEEKSEPEQKHAVSLVHGDGRLKTFKEIEIDIINEALTYCGHNISKTAQTLGLAKSTLYTKIAAIDYHPALKKE